MVQEKQDKCYCPFCEQELKNACLSPLFCLPCNVVFTQCAACVKPYNEKFEKCPECGAKNERK